MKRLYAYTSAATAYGGGSGTQKTVTIQFEPNEDFVWMYGAYSTTLAAIQNGTDVTHGGALIQIKGGSSQQQLTKTDTPINAFFGLSAPGSKGAVRLPYFHRFPGATSVVITCTNQAADHTFILVLLGAVLDPGAPLQG